MSASDFDPRDGICSGGQFAFVDRYMDLFNTHLSRINGESCQRFHSANRPDRKPCVRSNGERSTVPCSRSLSSLVVVGPLLVPQVVPVFCHK